MKDLLEKYNQRKAQIKKRLGEFENIHKGTNEDIFSELSFCILTPQSKAVYCDRAIQDLKSSRILFKGNAHAVRSRLKGVRFPNNKAAYLVGARKFLRGINNRIDSNNNFAAREWIAKNVKGLGYKEASHFLRNIGLGKDLAILDVHILKNLKKYNVITEIPKTLNKKTYLEIEDKMKKFAKKISIPVEELDLLFWSNQTGFIFK